MPNINTYCAFLTFKMFSNIDENKLFYNGEFNYITCRLTGINRHNRFPNDDNNYIFEHKLITTTPFNYNICGRSEVEINNMPTFNIPNDPHGVVRLNNFILQLKARFTDIKLRFKFIPFETKTRNLSHNTYYTNNALIIYTNYNFIIQINNVALRDYQNCVMQVYGNMIYGNRMSSNYNFIYYIKSQKHQVNITSLMDFNWPEFPIEKRILPAVYFDYLLENNQNCEFEHAIATTQADKAALEATLATTQTEKATLEATVNDQARRIVDLMTDLNTQDNMLIDLKAKYELLKIDYDNIKTQLTNELAKSQVSTDNTPLLNERKKRCVIM